MIDIIDKQTEILVSFFILYIKLSEKLCNKETSFENLENCFRLLLICVHVCFACTCVCVLCTCVFCCMCVWVLCTCLVPTEVIGNWSYRWL